MITVFLTSVFFKPFLTIAGKCVQPKTLLRSSGGAGWFSCLLSVREHIQVKGHQWRRTELADLLRKHGGKTSAKLKAAGN